MICFRKGLTAKALWRNLTLVPVFHAKSKIKTVVLILH